MKPLPQITMSDEMKGIALTIIGTALVALVGDLYVRIADLEKVALSRDITIYRINRLEKEVFKDN